MIFFTSIFEEFMVSKKKIPKQLLLLILLNIFLRIWTNVPKKIIEIPTQNYALS